MLEVSSSSPSCVALYRQFLPEASKKDDEGGDSEEDEEDATADTPKPVDPLESALAVALIDHALGIKHALSLYGRPAYQATQAELMRRFEVSFSPEIASLASTTVPETSPLPSQRQSPNPMDSRQQHATGRVSPEQELIRSSRIGHNRKHSTRQSVSHRIGSMNPFKRSHHGATGSVSTAVAETRQALEGKTNGTLTEHAEENGEPDNETATINSRTTSHSRETYSKRRSFFGVDKPYKHGSSLSIATASVPTDDAHKHRKQSSRSTSRDTVSKPSHDIHIQPVAPQNGGPKSPTSPHAGWSTIPSVRETPRPATGQQSVNSIKGPMSPTSPNGAAHTSGGVRDSVMKRFSLLRGVGRKNSRLDFKADTHGGLVHEE